METDEVDAEGIEFTQRIHELETTRQEAAASVAEGRKQALDAIQKQLDAQHDLRDQAALSARAAEKSAAIAAQALTFSERPWLTMDIQPTGRLEIAQSGIFLTLNVQTKNVGKSVASGVRIETQIIPYPTGESALVDIISARNKLCAVTRRALEKGPDSEGESIFLGSEGFTRSVGFLLSRTKVEQAEQEDHRVTPMILICAAYNSAYDRKSHVTARVFIVLVKEFEGNIFVDGIPSPTKPRSFKPGQFALGTTPYAIMYAD